MSAKSKFDGIERRKFARVEDTLQVKFRIVNAADGRFISDYQECISRDISRSGMCIQISNPSRELIKTIENKSNMMDLELRLPSEHDVAIKGSISYVKIKGELVWTESGNTILETGIKFLEIAPKDMGLITDYITSKYIKKYGHK